ncbi:hypothetical protein KIN20_024571 [Parelaphostrongylus tenuis]|uniref:Uncharacterized protein n=1 Tax=Parelaphostrongylus tenuis TaxID=148309 RepID=A0AAD5NCW5_PARTN|nr:hypothetical protein KIN20_024571 [Parelaphostrongylus tenuis]
MDMRNDIATSVVAIVAANCRGIIAVSWFHYSLDHVPILVGVRAERDRLIRILKIAMEHDNRIRCIHHAVVYHTGVQATVELHIVMDKKLPLEVRFIT